MTQQEPRAIPRAPSKTDEFRRTSTRSRCPPAIEAARSSSDNLACESNRRRSRRRTADAEVARLEGKKCSVPGQSSSGRLAAVLAQDEGADTSARLKIVCMISDRKSEIASRYLC